MSDEIFVPAGHGRAVIVRAGQRFDIVDVEGEQVADVAAVAADDHDEHVFMPVTRLALGRTEFRHGDSLLTKHRRPILRLDRDPVGTHDILFGVCDRYRYEVDFGLPPGHRNCRDNFVEAFASLGVSERAAHVAADNGLNVFINQRLDEAGNFHLETPLRARRRGRVHRADRRSCRCVGMPRESNRLQRRASTPMLIRLH